MRRVAEVIYVVPEEREAYMNAHLNPSERVAQILWIHGIRNQCFYALNDVLDVYKRQRWWRPARIRETHTLSASMR